MSSFGLRRQKATTLLVGSSSSAHLSGRPVEISTSTTNPDWKARKMDSSPDGVRYHIHPAESNQRTRHGGILGSTSCPRGLSFKH